MSGLCGYAVTDRDGEQQPCDRPATGWRWYQDCEHEDMLDVACDWHANEGGRRIHEAEVAVARVRALVPVVRFDEDPPRTEYLLRRGVLAALAGDDEAGMGPRERGNGHESDERGTGGGRVHRDAERGSNANDVIRGDG